MRRLFQASHKPGEAQSESDAGTAVDKKSALVPSPAVLTGLFDLTPAEAKFAAALVSGQSVKEASLTVGITESSGRTYLARIFAKTGTHRQTELVTLLAAAHPFDEAMPDRALTPL